MISLVLGPKDQIARATQMLVAEYGTASNIKSRTNRASVLSAITSAQQRLKMHDRVPANGLVLYVGTVLSEEDGKERKVAIDFEPFRPLQTSMYLCDSRFHTEPLADLVRAQDARYGVVVVDGRGALFGVLCGSSKHVLHELSVDLPRKHNKGGQSALRFARLREEKRHNYVRKVAETATRLFVDPQRALPNVQGLVLAGSADFKTELLGSDLFDARLRAVVLAVVDVAYGGNIGFNQALEQASGTLAGLRLVQEKRAIGRLFDSLGRGDDLCAVGVVDTLRCLEAGAVDTLLVWEDLNARLPASTSSVSSQPSESQPSQQPLLLEWLVEEHSRHGCTLEIVTDKTQEGAQFCHGLGGVGALLRYAAPFCHDEDDCAGTGTERDWDDDDDVF